jgi:hypothetical protein
MRLRLMLAALVVAGAVLAWQLSRVGGTGLDLPLFDFVEYWAAGHLNAHGENPYDHDQVEELERQAGRTEKPVLMWNPPWTLTLAMPFGLFPLDHIRLAQLLWLLLQFAALVYSADALWRYYGGDAGQRWLAWLIAFTFVPSLFALTAGQIAPLILLGPVLFLQCERRGLHALAGAAAVLLAIKPHIVYLFWLALLLGAIERRRWSLLAGGIVTGLVATLIPLVCNPHVLGQYVSTMTTRPPDEYRSPTLGRVVRMAFGEDVFHLQFVALLPGLLWFAFYWPRQRRAWDWGERLPLLLLVSMLTAPYGAWPFDLVILLVPVMQVAARLHREGRRPRRNAAVAFHLAVNGVALGLLVAGAEFFWFIWMTPALLAGYLAFLPPRNPAAEH